MRSHLPLLAALIALLTCAPSLYGQDAKTLRQQAEAEPNQERQVTLLCKAADLEPKNREYRKDCEVSRAALISSDRTMLKTAQDASEAGKIPTARRYAKYVSTLDPELHKQAEQLLAKLNATENPPPPPPPAQTQPTGPNQTALLSQAATAFDGGNLQAAKADAQSITEASLKPAANRLLADIDRYTGYVAAGQRHEQAREYTEAEHAYQSALDLNAHVASDDLAGKMQRLRQLAATQKAPPLVAVNHPPTTNSPTDASKNPRQPPELSPDEKKRHLLDDGAQAIARNDLDTAGRRFKQVLDLDPANADAKRGLAEITTALNKDPIRLEKTLREAIIAFYDSHFEDAESRFNRYLGADGGKKKGAAFFYLGATEATLSFLETSSRRADREREAKEDFKQARLAGYQPIDRYVSRRVLGVWKSTGL